MSQRRQLRGGGGRRRPPPDEMVSPAGHSRAPGLPQPRLYVPCPRWREGKFQEVVEAEYVLLEMNGLFTYTYSLTAGMAGCSAQPQNWTTITEMAGDTAPFSWDREVRPALLSSPRAGLGRRCPVMRSVCWEPARPVQAAANQTPETPGAFNSSMGFSRVLETEVQHQAASRFGVWFTGDPSCVLTEQKGWGSSSRCLCAQVRVQSCQTLQPHGLWPRCGPRPPPAPGLLWAWGSPGKNTGVGCHFLLQAQVPL